MPSKSTYSNIIIGAGIAGLSAAYKLNQAGEDFLLIDSASEVGGNWQSHKYKNSIYEFGPNTLMNRSEEINQMISDLGIQDQVLTEKFKDSVRYLYLDDKFYEIGSNPLKILLSGIISPWAIVRLALEPFIRKQGSTVIASAAKQSTSSKQDESVYSFISRRFGKEIAQRIVAPALQGIWAGDTKNLSARVALKNLVEYEYKFGSVLKGLFLSKREAKKKELASMSFKSGMQDFAQLIAKSFKQESISLGKKVQSIENVQGSQSYLIKLESGEELQTKQLIVATKAFQAAILLEAVSPRLSKQLSRIYYAPVFLIAFTLSKNLFKLNNKPKGFGYISAKQEDLTLGTIFSSELFHERNLEDEYLLQSFVGGSKNPQILDFSETDLILQAVSEQKRVFKNTFGLDLKDSDFNIVNSKMISQAIPQYQLGFAEIKSAIDLELKMLPGLRLVGNYLAGVSIPDTVKLSFQETILGI